MIKQSLVASIVLSLGLIAAPLALAQSGFYGGVSLPDGSLGATGLKVGALPFAWNLSGAAIPDDTQQRSLVFGGYRWSGDVAVEAAVNTTDKYALPPRLPAQGGGATFATSDLGTRTWNADVYTSWEFMRSLSLYGRLGYAQTDTRPLFAPASAVPGDPRRQRDGVNYGVGVRYDLTQSLGLRVEYSRFGRFAGEGASAGILPDSDQVTIGVQFRF